MTYNYAQTCFVDMPYGKKIDPTTGVEVDFDDIFKRGIEPAVEKANLRCIRGDQEKSGGIIHQAMFARLLLCDFVIADLTSANANVFYELGIRHTARPYTTIPIFSPLSALPFDVAMIRAIPYELTWDHKGKKKGKKARLTDGAAKKLQAGIIERVRDATQPPVERDSPIFQFFDSFPRIELSHEITEVFQREVRVSDEFQDDLDAALAKAAKTDKVQAVRAIQKRLRGDHNDLHSVQGEILLRLLLTYRDLSAWDDMIELFDQMPGAVQESVVALQQTALALNRRAEGFEKGAAPNLAAARADRRRAERLIAGVLKEHGASAETYGILGRIHKSQYLAALAAKRSTEALGHLDDAIAAYVKGFEAEPIDFYPGVNALNLLAQRATREAEQEIARLMPLVTFAVARRGGLSSDDYWDRATVLELALIDRQDKAAKAALPGVLAKGVFEWMVETTADNLDMILAVRTRKKERVTTLRECVRALREKQAQLAK